MIELINRNRWIQIGKFYKYIWRSISHFKKEYFEQNDTLEDFLDTVAETITQSYLKWIQDKIKRNKKIQAVHFSASKIYFLESGNGFINYSDEEKYRLVYGYIRYFIMERKLPLPDASFSEKEQISWLFSEQVLPALPEPGREKFDSDMAYFESQIQYMDEYSRRVCWRINDNEKPENYKSPTKFILYLIEKNNKENISMKYYLNERELRNFICADMYYLDKYIGIIEIELDSYWKGISTWFFISDDTQFKFTADIAQDIISHYIGECKTYSELESYIKITYGLILYKKPHVKKMEEDHLLHHWVDDVLRDLSEIN